MQENYLNYSVPSFYRNETYNPTTTDDALEVYNELNLISEEIEKCRLRNC